MEKRERTKTKAASRRKRGKLSCGGYKIGKFFSGKERKTSGNE